MNNHNIQVQGAKIEFVVTNNHNIQVQGAKIEFLSTHTNFVSLLDIMRLLHVSAYVKAIIR